LFRSSITSIYRCNLRFPYKLTCIAFSAVCSRNKKVHRSTNISRWNLIFYYGHFQRKNNWHVCWKEVVIKLCRPLSLSLYGNGLAWDIHQNFKIQTKVVLTLLVLCLRYLLGAQKVEVKKLFYKITKEFNMWSKRKHNRLNKPCVDCWLVPMCVNERKTCRTEERCKWPAWKETSFCLWFVSCDRSVNWWMTSCVVLWKLHP